MRNRYAGLLCVLGLSIVAVGCYNNPDVSSRPPGSGVKDIHSGPQVGPGTTAGWGNRRSTTCGEGSAIRVEPTHGAATGDSPSPDHAGAATPEKHDAGAPVGQSRTRALNETLTEALTGSKRVR